VGKACVLDLLPFIALQQILLDFADLTRKIRFVQRTIR